MAVPWCSGEVVVTRALSVAISLAMVDPVLTADLDVATGAATGAHPVAGVACR